MNQHTLAQPIYTSGIGLHSGERVAIALLPAPVDHGIRFVRRDLPGHPGFAIEDGLANETTLCTGLACGEATVRTIEHLMSSIAAVGLDNISIELDAAEVPIFDGSAATWIFLMREAGMVEQPAGRLAWKLREPIAVEKGGSRAVLTPAEAFTAEVTIDFTHPAITIQGQKARWDGDMDTFANRIARARTFGFMQQVEHMNAHGLGLGGSLDNAVVYGDHQVINLDGLRVRDEAAQHKLLDAIGDVWVLGRMPLAHLDVYKPGHTINQELVAHARASGSLVSVRWVDGQWVEDEPHPGRALPVEEANSPLRGIVDRARQRWRRRALGSGGAV
jgi:UDP-3-O-[3-hydroxymyristoyl] N-acetylglucosamine deacetylase